MTTFSFQPVWLPNSKVSVGGDFKFLTLRRLLHAVSSKEGVGTVRAKHGTIALLNPSAQIDAMEPHVRLRRATVEVRAGLVELVSLWGLILGRIADYEGAEEIADQLMRDAPGDARAWVARARTRAGFHRFNDVLADLDCAEQLSLDAENGQERAGRHLPGSRTLR